MKLYSSVLLVSALACVKGAPAENEELLQHALKHSLRGRLDERRFHEVETNKTAVVFRQLAEDDKKEDDKKEDEPPVMPNIEYILIGYDIMKGNPLDTSGKNKIDPGFTTPIFDAGADGYSLTPDKRHSVPSKISILGCEGCDLSFQTTVVESSKSDCHSYLDVARTFEYYLA